MAYKIGQDALALLNNSHVYHHLASRVDNSMVSIYKMYFIKIYFY